MARTLTEHPEAWAMVDASGDCWEWTGHSWEMWGGSQYGWYVFDGFQAPIHRWVYEQLVGEIPDELFIDHLCRNTLCVNPDHLEPVTNGENILRGYSPWAKNARKTHCIRGHSLLGDNVYVPPKRPNRRYCRACQKERKRQHKEREAIRGSLHSRHHRR